MVISSALETSASGSSRSGAVTDVSASTSETDTPISAATAQSIRAVTMGRRSTEADGTVIVSETIN